jgi:hypothetical protein
MLCSYFSYHESSLKNITKSYLVTENVTGFCKYKYVPEVSKGEGEGWRHVSHTANTSFHFFGHPFSTFPTFGPCTYNTVITLETSDVSALPTLFSHSPQFCQTSFHYTSFCTILWLQPSTNRSLYTGMYTLFTQIPHKMRMTDMLNIWTHDIQSLSTYCNIKPTYVKQISNTDSTLPSPLRKKQLPA